MAESLCVWLTRLLLRLLHLATSCFTLTLVVLDAFFDFRSYGVVQESASFKQMQSAAGLGMIFSGFALTHLMRKTHATNTQNVWLGMLSRKFVVSLLLTPFFDKIVAIVLGPLAREPEWQQVISSLRLCTCGGLYLYSAHTRDFREESGDFEDRRGFAKVLENMTRKLE